MGNSASADQAEDDEALLDPFDGADTLGYRVLGVQPDSPASKAGLVSFLDFLVGANGEMLLSSGENVEHGEEYPDVDLPKLLQENIGKPVEFLVWNMKSQQQRLVNLTPDDDWGGAGLLGVTIRLDNYAGAEERLVRVLEVDSPQSPAAMAGLVPFNDYILGTTSETLQDTAQLGAILEENVDRVVELYVYNCQSDLVRNVALMPTLSWGGPGLLGAAVGTGYLHRFPAKVQETNGASVERKVRYIGTYPSKPSPSSSSGAKVSSAEADAAGASGLTTQQQQQQQLELEPQLEMEVPSDSESDRDADEAVNGSQPTTPEKAQRPSSQTKNNEQEGSTKHFQQQPGEQEEENRQSSRETESRATQQQISQPEAAAVFAAPPPET